MSEWADYSITIPGRAGPRRSDGRVLDTVYHVVHAADARRILEDGKLKARLIYDESILRRSRISVSWLSANTWGPGSIYGNVEFAFSWAEQIGGRQFYWVEAITKYSPHAYRILATDRDLSRSKYVKPYDPSFDRGPLRKRGGLWYWNDEFTSEFMIEGDVDLEECTGFGFIAHNARRCRLYGSVCPDLLTPTYRTGGCVIAFLLGNGVHSIDHVLKQPPHFDSERILSAAVKMGINGIICALGSRSDWFGGVIRSASSGKAVVRGALALYGSGKKKAARELIVLLHSRRVFEKSLTELVNEHFKITNWTIGD